MIVISIVANAIAPLFQPLFVLAAAFDTVNHSLLITVPSASLMSLLHGSTPSSQESSRVYSVGFSLSFPTLKFGVPLGVLSGLLLSQDFRSSISS